MEDQFQSIVHQNTRDAVVVEFWHIVAKLSGQNLFK